MSDHRILATRLRSGRLAEPRGTAPVPMTDSFDDRRPAGRVVGTTTPAGVVRHGRDVERRIAIDNGALRLQPLIRPGWGRQGVAYGPFRRTPGLTFAVSITNGHNTSQGDRLPESFRHRVWRWVVGAETRRPLARLVAWLGSRQQRGTLRRLRWWLAQTGTTARVVHNENLAVGWFADQAPEDPLAGGAAFVVHAAEGENGELWARVCGRPLPAFRRLQNLQICYLIVLREQGAAYYASSLPHACGLAPFPQMRPLAIEPFDRQETLFAGIQQCVLGQIGFRVDTRVQAVSVAQADGLAAWYGSAHAADALVGTGDLAAAPAEVGGRWRVLAGRYALTPRGARPAEAGALAVLDPGVPTGLLHLLLEPASEARAAIGIVWRLRDEHNYWMVVVAPTCCQLILVERSARALVAQDDGRRLPGDATCSVQILDGHGQFGVYLDGARLFDRWFADARLQEASGVGFRAEQAAAPPIRAFEAHPASVPIPSSIRLAPPWQRTGERVVVADRFAGAPGDLMGHVGEQGGAAWQKILGTGAIEVTGDGAARVRASVETPNPGRLAYVVDWQDPDFADVEVTIVPPGSGRGQAEECRAGLIFWQDPANYLTFTSYLSDPYHGASIALFSHLNGFEELYDAIWSMVWTKIDWGKPFRLRIAFDGMRFTVLIDGEPVLHRALSDLYPRQPPLRLNRLGLAVNWEWGDDTGSLFRNFVARA